jgi:ADP-heptose:LPS heptosyltransferase
MNKKRIVILIDGGIGRVICAIPALEKYVKSHLEEDIKILVYGWDSLLWSNKILQPITYNINDKGVFDNHIKDADVVISPEPYRLPEYFKQKMTLIQAFDFLLNNSTESTLPYLYISELEKINARKILEDVKKYQNKEKTIVIQPFGSTASFESVANNDVISDDTSRSMSLEMYSIIARQLANNYNIVLFADNKFHFKEDVYSYKLTADLRTHMSVISQADYFIGCDSVGQHMARAFSIPGTVILGSTFVENITYPEWFNIFDKCKNTKVYNPMRINDIDSNMANRLNESCMDYTQGEIEDICKKISADIKKKVK